MAASKFASRCPSLRTMVIVSMSHCFFCLAAQKLGGGGHCVGVPSGVEQPL